MANYYDKAIEKAKEDITEEQIEAYKKMKKVVYNKTYTSNEIETMLAHQFVMESGIKGI